MVSHNKIVIEGLLGTQEVWSTGFAVGNSIGDVIVDQADLTNLAEDMFGWLANSTNSGILLNCLSSQGKITKVTARAYDTSGDLIDQGTYDGADISGLGTQTMPYQTCVVFTLRTLSPSRRRRGRMYWPLIGGNLTAGRMSTPTSPSDIVTQAASLLEYAGTTASTVVPGGPVFPAVYSPTAGFVTAVTAVSVGDVPDTQRRRRDALIENYSTATIP